MRKIITILLALGVLLCGGCAERETDKDIKTLTVWSGDSHSKDFMLEKISEFNKTIGKENGLRIEYSVKPNMNKLIEAALVSGTAPDLFVAGVNKDWYINNEFIIPLNDLAGGSEYIAEYDPQLLKSEMYTQNGKVYTVPFSTTTYGLAYNKKMFKKAGIVDENGEAKPPETLEEMREVAKKLTNPKKQEYGIMFPAKWDGWYGSDINDVASVSSGVMNGYNPVTGLYEYGVFAEIMKIYMGIKADGSCFPGSEGLDNDPARAKFSMGKVGMKFVASYDYAVLTDQFPAVFDWGVAPLPVLEGYERHKAYNYVGGSYYINTQVKGEFSDEQVMLAFRYLTDREMLRAAYIAGKSIPYDFEIVRDIELPDKMQNWKIFAERVETSFMQNKTAKTDRNGERDVGAIWLDIWTGKIPEDLLEAYIMKCEQGYNIGIQNYIKAHPEYDYQAQIDKDFDTSLD